MKKLLITDLDDTLYDWIGFFIPAFYAMLDKLSEITSIDRERLIYEYKKIHQKFGSVEYPFATLELPSIKKKYSGLSPNEVKTLIDEAFYCFNSVRKKELKLYDGVLDTIKFLSDKGITIIGYTESAQENGLYRLNKLNISKYFKHVYSSKSDYINENIVDEKAKYVYVKKPNKDVLLSICKTENCAVQEAVYIGDSLTKDIYMAKKAGIASVWADYPKKKNNYYDLLVNITSWTEEDFKHEEELKKQYFASGMQPDFTISNFKQLIPIVLDSKDLSSCDNICPS